MGHDNKYSDRNLIEELLQSGADVRAFERVFHRYYPMVLNFIKGMLKDFVMAEDVAQNIFMRLWLNRSTLHKDQSLKNYLCIMARNEVINILSSKSSKSLTLQPTIQDSYLMDHRSVEDWLSYNETNTRIQNDIEALPPQRRAVFKMSRYEHMSNMEIAVKLNLSVRTVEKHIELALKDLRRSMS